MYTESKAIVISTLKYSDQSLIVKLYTESHGILPFLVKNVHQKKSKTSAFFQPLNSLQIVFRNPGKQNLNYIKQTGINVHWQTINSNPVKSCVALFLSEILGYALKEEESNKPLFNFILGSLKAYDGKTQAFADFHLWFLIRLTEYLGFYPNSELNHLPYFDLENGIYSYENNSAAISGDLLNLFKKVLAFDFYAQEKNILNQNQRKQLLDILMQYYKFHLSGFREPKSLIVLQEVFS